MTYILVLYIYAGAFARGDSVAIQSIPNFKTLAACKAAGAAALPLVKDTTKELRFVCLEQP
jgi:hypothetical protein